MASPLRWMPQHLHEDLNLGLAWRTLNGNRSYGIEACQRSHQPSVHSSETPCPRIDILLVQRGGWGLFCCPCWFSQSCMKSQSCLILRTSVERVDVGHYFPLGSFLQKYSVVSGAHPVQVIQRWCWKGAEEKRKVQLELEPGAPPDSALVLIACVHDLDVQMTLSSFSGFSWRKWNLLEAISRWEGRLRPW